MRILIIGGTRLSGPFLVRDLFRMGHEVTVCHRGNNPRNIPAGVSEILLPRKAGEAPDRHHLRDFADQFRAIKPDVVIHMIAMTRDDAEVFVDVFRGIAGRAVVASSSDVYRVMGIINRTEPGPIIPMPLDEDAPQREKPSIHGDKSEKRFVEQIVRSEPKLHATILRYPAIYGPGTYRRQDWIKRMLDNRPAILVGTGEAGFRFSHSFAEDIGHATALAATDDRGAGRTYNVGEKAVPTERKRMEDFARVAGWSGRIIELADETLPGSDGLPWPGQDWVLDTTRIRSELGFAEVSDYEQGIRATIEWQRDNPGPIDPKAFDYEAEDRLIAANRL